MTTSFSELESILREAAPLLATRKTVGVKDAGLDAFLLFLKGPEEKEPRVLKLFISLRAGLDRLHLTFRSPAKKQTWVKTAFATELEEALEGLVVRDARLLNDDRIVRLAFVKERSSRQKPSRQKILIAELIGRHANLLLLDEHSTILLALREFEGKHRLIKRGAAYQPLPVQEDQQRVNPPPRFTTELNDRSVAPFNAAADQYFAAQEEELLSKQLRERLLKHLARRLKKLEGKRARLEEELAQARQADRFQKQGDLLKAHFHLLKRGLDAVEVPDLFAVDNPTVRIPLDPAKTPAENVARYYKKQKKARAAIPHLKRRLEACEERKETLRDMGNTLPMEQSLEALQALETRLNLTPAPRIASRKGKKPEARTPERRFLSRNGLAILVGKDGASNARLTFQMARGNDYWLHCREAAGSHVVVRAEKNKSVPLESLLDAGLLAVHFSKKRGAEKAEVIYTQRKHVRKIRHAPPGRVSVERFKTLLVQGDPDRLQRLLDSAEKQDEP